MRVLTVDDNALIRLGVRAALETFDDVESVAETDDPDVALTAVADGAVDVVLLDVRMPKVSGLDLLPGLVEHATVVMLTHTEDSEVLQEAMSAGAAGYIVHGSLSPEEMLNVLRLCAAGSQVVTGVPARWHAGRGGEAGGADSASARERFGLSPREHEVMEAIARGRVNAEIARELVLSEKTVKNHVNSIFAKLAVASRGQAIARWRDAVDGVGPGA
ncbi:response regulator transcription factor [Isoptericola chiayiensis]|uniref:Response regulator transcription factor n=1 Tax=Isoptericola chiayiensis TaxID=579446 RepID=A0ABP8YAD6_9MICO|nr:response regulator transcription factor [Isoptericola chiayiensis]NOW02083.1 DNA-binding NarL/FixJ family response regulator [Isoptericola chiayiensis]